jgi:hypothetical protein
VRTLSHVFFVDPSPVRRVPIPTGIQRKLNFVSVRTIKGSSSSGVGVFHGRGVQAALAHSSLAEE